MDLLLMRGSWLILMSLCVCLALHYLPMGEALSFARPVWIAMFIIYWGHVTPGRFGIWLSFALGLYLDVLLTKPLGLHAFALVLLAFLCHVFHRRMRVFSTVQKMLVVAVFTGGYLLITHLLESFSLSGHIISMAYWTPILTSALVWPWFYLALDTLRRRFMGVDVHI